MTDDLYEEIQITNSICDDHIVKIKGLYINKSNIFLFYPKLISLYEFIHVQGNKLTISEKLDMARQLAECIMKIHESKSNMIHCHLSSRNVFIEQIKINDKTINKLKLGDLGDLSIRQSAKVF